MNNSETLTLQQKRFCDEYLVSFNAFRAAICAGYSENTARKAELLHSPKIQAYLQDAMAKTANRLQITHDMILRELAKVAFSNMGNYYDEYGTAKSMFHLSSDEKAAISEYNVIDNVDRDGNHTGYLTKIKLHNKMSALDKIARHLGFFNQNQDARIRNQEPEIEKQELRCKNQEEEPAADAAELAAAVMVVNDEGELASEPVETDDVNKEAVTAGKILTLSPQGDKRVNEPGERKETEKPGHWLSAGR